MRRAVAMAVCCASVSVGWWLWAQQAATSDDREGVSAALHALVGLAGEVVAQALHARARERYAGWLEGQRPGGEAWTRELRELLEATERALWQYCGVRAERVPPLG